MIPCEHPKNALHPGRVKVNNSGDYVTVCLRCRKAVSLIATPIGYEELLSQLETPSMTEE